MTTASYTQETRRIAVETPFGGDVLLLTSFTGREEMSRLFSYELQMLAARDKKLAAADIIGKRISFRVDYEDETPRYFNGFVRRFAYLGSDDRVSHYRAEVVPWLWFLTRTSDCRIFQTKSVPEIIEQIFNDLGFTDFEMSCKGKHEKWDYCVQYRETDFNFVSRLMEHEGIFYFFRHEKDKHTLVVADGTHAYQACRDKQAVCASTLNEHHSTDNVTRWEHGYEFRTGKWAHTDYNFETPATKLLVNVDTLVKVGNNTKFEFYDFPGEFEKAEQAEGEAKLRIEEVEAGHETVQGSSHCRSFGPGGKFTLTKHAADAEEGKGYVITSVQHTASVGDTYTTGGASEEHYGNAFTCIPEKFVCRPARITPKPMIHGVQTAVVVGPAGDEIYVDKYGRVKVQFHWDREGKKDAESSCWVRVSQPWAGTNWGAVWHPRIGQEVIVSFLEGDPDRPIITGRVYNAEQMPPYELPANKTQSGFKSRSSKEGTPDNFNEIRFEDKKGDEQLFIHAEKNQDIEVENDETHWVGHDRKKTIDHDERVGIGNDRTESVGNNEKITIGNDRTENVSKNEKISIGVNRNTDVGKNEDITVGENRTESVTKDETVTIGGNRTHTINKIETLDVKDKRTTTIAKSDSLSVGTKFALVAADEILLQTGDASILMKKNGDIQIKGNNITVVGSGKIGIKADGNMTLKGSKIAEN